MKTITFAGVTINCNDMFNIVEHKMEYTGQHSYDYNIGQDMTINIKTSCLGAVIAIHIYTKTWEDTNDMDVLTASNVINIKYKEHEENSFMRGIQIADGKALCKQIKMRFPVNHNEIMTINVDNTRDQCDGIYYGMVTFA